MTPFVAGYAAGCLTPFALASCVGVVLLWRVVRRDRSRGAGMIVVALRPELTVNPRDAAATERLLRELFEEGT